MPNQRLELTWIGKYDPQSKINPEPRILIENPAYSYAADPQGQTLLGGATPITDNMLIHGDNLLALKSLEQEYAGRVKCIYIDPPYNTGSAFEHYDDNLEHSTWLSLMKPRLELLRLLLTEDGSIWINIDDDEQAYLKVLCDEVFGRPNYMTTMIWQKRTSPDMRAAISDAHEYVLVYAKNKELFKRAINKLPVSDSLSETYQNPDNDPNGTWVSSDFTAPGFRPNQMYKIVTPGGAEYTPPEGRCWKNIEPVFLEQLKAGRMWFGADGKGIPRRKKYLRDHEGMVPWTWWTNKEVGHSQEAKKENILLFGAANTFATPKPERLIERVLTLATNPGDLVLDSFLGSGTTAAVAHKMGRRWIGIELGEHAYTHCYPRMKAVVDGEQGGISKAQGWQGGGGFKFYELAPSILETNSFGNMVISDKYSTEMLAQAMAKHEGYEYAPDPDTLWKQGNGGEKNFIFTTANAVTVEFVEYISTELGVDEYLLICARSFDQNAAKLHKNITIKPIPKILFGRCEYGRDNYDLNVILADVDEWEDECDE